MSRLRIELIDSIRDSPMPLLGVLVLVLVLVLMLVLVLVHRYYLG